MSDPIEQDGGPRDWPRDQASANRMGDDAREELARLRAQVERLMQERVTPALARSAEIAEEYGQRAREALEDQAEATTAVGDLPGAFDDAMDEMMGSFDARLVDVNRRLDRVLERRR